MSSKIRLTIDAEKAAKISELAAEIALTALDEAQGDIKQTLAAQLDKATLYLHVQVHPSRLVILASDPNFPELPPVELAEWS